MERRKKKIKEKRKATWNVSPSQSENESISPAGDRGRRRRRRRLERRGSRPGVTAKSERKIRIYTFVLLQNAVWEIRAHVQNFFCPNITKPLSLLEARAKKRKEMTRSAR